MAELEVVDAKEGSEMNEENTIRCLDQGFAHPSAPVRSGDEKTDDRPNGLVVDSFQGRRTVQHGELGPWGDRTPPDGTAPKIGQDAGRFA